MKLKPLVAAVGLAVCAGTANAAISVGNNTSAQPPGELFLTVFDPVSQRTYTRDLGIEVAGNSAFNFDTGNLSIAPDQRFLDAIGANNTQAVYGVFAANFYDDPFNENFGMFVLLTSDSSDAEVLATDSLTQFDTRFDNLRQYSEGSNSPSATGNNESTNYSLDLSGTLTDALSPGFYTSNFMGDDLGGLPISTGAGVGQALQFFSLGRNYVDLVNFVQQTENKRLGQWLLASDGTLTYTPVIPLPPALVLLGSALLGLAGIARRKTA